MGVWKGMSFQQQEQKKGVTLEDQKAALPSPREQKGLLPKWASTVTLRYNHNTQGPLATDPRVSTRIVSVVVKIQRKRYDSGLASTEPQLRSYALPAPLPQKTLGARQAEKRGPAALLLATHPVPQATSSTVLQH